MWCHGELMNRLRRKAVALCLLLVATGCGGGSKQPAAPTGSAGGGRPAESGLAQAFVQPLGCFDMVAVDRGIFGKCYLSQDDARHLVIKDDGSVSPLAEAGAVTSIGKEAAVSTEGDLVAVGRLKSADPLAAEPVGPEQLLVLELPAGKVKRAIPLPPPPEGTVSILEGVTGNTAVVQQYKDGVTRLVAYDVGGAKRWDVQVPEVPDGVETQVAEDVLLTSSSLPAPCPSAGACPRTRYRVAARSIKDGAVLWSKDREVGLAQGLTAPLNVGRKVLYDSRGGPLSLATGEPAGAGVPTEALSRDSEGGFLAFGPSAVTYEDDLILSDPLRRITPSGQEVWSLPGTTGTPATNGRVLLVRGRGALLALDPSTGRTVAQAPLADASRTCQPTLQVLGSLAVAGSSCITDPLVAHRIGRL